MRVDTEKEQSYVRQIQFWLFICYRYCPACEVDQAENLPNRRVGCSRSVGVARRNGVPTEDEAPVEATDLNTLRGGMVVLQSLRAYYVDHRYHHIGVILCYPVQ